MPEPCRFVSLTEPLRSEGTISTRCRVTCRVTIIATCLGWAVVLIQQHVGFLGSARTTSSQLFTRPTAGARQRMQHMHSVKHVAPPGVHGLLPMGRSESVGVLQAVGSEDAGQVITLHPRAIPNMRKAGPAEVNSEQADFLRSLMNEKHMVFDSSVAQVLEELSEQRDEDERQQVKTVDSDFETTLRKRTDAIRRDERRRIVTELLYLKACNKFKTKLLVPMVPSLKAGGDAMFGTVDPDSLSAQAHSQDAAKLVMERLYNTFGPKILAPPGTDEAQEVVKIALLEVAQIYSEFSVIGYGLRNANRRFRLTKMMSHVGVQDASSSGDSASTSTEDSSMQSLKDYMSSLGHDELKRMSIVNSAEVRAALELQVAGLFGDVDALREKYNAALSGASPDNKHSALGQALDNGEVESLRLTTEDLARLLLEAAAFGAMLNDAEMETTSVYELTPLH